MSAPWKYGWDALTLAVAGGWRFWAGLRNVWPAVAATGGTWLRRVWQARDADGGTVLQGLRRSRPGLPVVMMSADATPETVRHMRRLGARGFLAKPCAAVLLQALIAYLLL
jgi:DNA-binding NarL/FixJ family response regulator